MPRNYWRKNEDEKRKNYRKRNRKTNRKRYGPEPVDSDTPDTDESIAVEVKRKFENNNEENKTSECANDESESAKESDLDGKH